MERIPRLDQFSEHLYVGMAQEFDLDEFGKKTVRCSLRWIEVLIRAQLYTGLHAALDFCAR